MSTTAVSLDADRIAPWVFSGGGPLAADWLTKPPARLRCLAASCPVLAPLPDRGPTGERSTPSGRSHRRAPCPPSASVRDGRHPGSPPPRRRP
ncbi:hypothetical protein ACIP4Y_06860 [Streptomyces sp. NPDC088810]|uniref:hypothetical protein n=1 Tax=Streptomyces sp. NPDC088810 TaxID=3365904 RepID=UPI0038183FB0